MGKTEHAEGSKTNSNKLAEEVPYSSYPTLLTLGTEDSRSYESFVVQLETNVRILIAKSHKSMTTRMVDEAFIS